MKQETQKQEPMKQERFQEEVKRLLEAGIEGNAEEIFGCMLDDLLYFASLVDVQSALLKLLMMRGADVPPEICKLADHIPGMITPVLEKWEIYIRHLL